MYAIRRYYDAAYTFMNYILEPKVIAEISNYTSYASGNAASVPLVDEEIRNNPGVYPTAEASEKRGYLRILCAIRSYYG